MPNWCQNRLTVEGPRESLDRFREDVKVTTDEGEVVPFQVGSVVPEPPKGDPRRVPSSSCQGGWDWYSWRIDNWGSKWDVCDVALIEDAERLRYSFDSAWAPLSEGIRRMSMAYPDLTLTLTWFEFGMQFYGQAEMRNGEAASVLDAKFGSGAYEYTNDDCDDIEVVDPDLREFTTTHDFGFYA